MRKIKIIAIVLVLAFTVVLTACNANNDTVDAASRDAAVSDADTSLPESEAQDVSDEDAAIPTIESDSMDNEDASDPAVEDNNSGLEYTELALGELISLEFVEFSIEGAKTGDEIRPDSPESVYRYMSDEEDEKYVYLYGTIKNVSGDQYEFADNIYAQMTFDNKYNYAASITADEGGDFSYIYAYLDPLKSEKFYIIASIPDELAEQFEQVKVKFGFAENFDGEYNIQEDECDYLYSVTINSSSN